MRLRILVINNSATAATGFLLMLLQYNTIPRMCIASFNTIPTIFYIDLATLEHSIYVTCHRQKCLLYVLTGSSRCFQEPCPMKFSKVPTFLCRHSTFGITVCFVANHSIHSPLWLNVQLGLRQPALEMLKAASVCYVVHKQNTNRVPVVGFCNRPANKKHCCNELILNRYRQPVSAFSNMQHD